MQGFQWVLLGQAVYLSVGPIVAVSVEGVREGILAANGLVMNLGVSAFVLGCIALRLAVHFQYAPCTAFALFGLYTSGVTLMGCEFAARLQADYPPQEEDAEARGLHTGQLAVCVGCAGLLVSIVLVQSNALAQLAEPNVTATTSAAIHGVQPTKGGAPSTSSQPKSSAAATMTLRKSAIQSGVLVLLLSGLCLVTIDERVWDWRYALMIFLALILSVYFNTVSTWVASTQPPPIEAFHTVALVILQPVLFAEQWVYVCLVGA
jgi:hypothetical protein